MCASFGASHFQRRQDGQVTREDVSSLWRLADADGNGRVDLNEFVALLRQVQLEVS